MDFSDRPITSFNRAILNITSPLMDPINAFNQSPIKGIFFIHFMLITCAMLITNWMPGVFLFYNMIFFLFLWWSMFAKENPEPVQLAAIINLLSLIFDIIAMASNYDYNHYRGGFGFSFFLLCCNILARTFTSFILLSIYSDRDIRQTMYGGGLASVTTGSGIVNPNHEQFRNVNSRSNRGYQDIDHQVETNNNSQPTSSIPNSNDLPYQSVPGPILIDTK